MEECLFEIVGSQQTRLVGVVMIKCLLDEDNVGFGKFPGDVQTGLELLQCPLGLG